MKLPITEVIENVKDELLCYEGAEQTAERWEKEFLQCVEEHKGKDKDIIVDGGQVSLKIRDEEEIFEIADSYMDVLDEGSVKQYWEKF